MPYCTTEQAQNMVMEYGDAYHTIYTIWYVATSCEELSDELSADRCTWLTVYHFSFMSVSLSLSFLHSMIADGALQRAFAATTWNFRFFPTQKSIHIW